MDNEDSKRFARKG